MEKKITEMYAFIAPEKDGQEGVIAFQGPQGWMPLVGADIARAKSYIAIADEISRQSQRPYRIKKFTNMIDVTDEIKKP